MVGCYCFITLTEKERRRAITEEFLDNVNYGMRNQHLIDKEPNETKLEIYSLGMQGWFGDNFMNRPLDPFDIVGKAKWDAYEQKRGVPRIEAQEQFNDLLYYLGYYLPEWWTSDMRTYDNYKPIEL